MPCTFAWDVHTNESKNNASINNKLELLKTSPKNKTATPTTATCASPKINANVHFFLTMAIEIPRNFHWTLDCYDLLHSAHLYFIHISMVRERDSDNN